MQSPLETADGALCISFLEQMLRHELSQSTPDVAKLSIALGAVELSLTPKDVSKQRWPTDLPGTVAQLDAAFEAYVEELAGSATLSAARSAAAKVKIVADAVWSKLNKGYSKDLQHAQHVYSFAALLLPGGMPGLKKQLDCAGVVTTTYAICHALSRRFPQHADLAAARMQISEDHCWIQLGSGGQRETSVEITTDTAAKRGLPVAPDAWGGWLYTGGHAVLCTPHQALAAIITSLNPSISGGKKRSDSEELQAVQQRLLEVVKEVEPGALYPAALCALADLKEVASQDALDAARDGGDAVRLAQLLQRCPGDAQELFERAIRLAGGSSDPCAPPSSKIANAVGDAGLDASNHKNAAMAGEPAGFVASVQQPGSDCNGSMEPQPEVEQQAQQLQPPSLQQRAAACNGDAAIAMPENGSGSRVCGSEPGYQWYVYSYIAAYLARRAEFLASCAAGFGEQYWQAAVGTYCAALEAASQGGAVLARYRFSPSTDEQLFKDVESVLDEVVREGLTALAKRQPGSQLSEPTALASLLLLWDGICHLFAGKAKPSGWVALLMKVAKLFSGEAREAAAAAVEGRVSSGPMLAARGLWRELKPVPLRPLFESADVAAGSAEPAERTAKRQRR